MAKLTPNDYKLIKTLADDTRRVGYGLAEESKLVRLIKEGLVETGGPNPENEKQVFARVTEKGLAAYPGEVHIPDAANLDPQNIANFESEVGNTMSDVQTTPVETAAVGNNTRAKRAHTAVDVSSITTGSGLPPQVVRGGGAGRKAVYPFAEQAAPVMNEDGTAPLSMSYFFVPATADRENVARSLNATISSHNKRVADVIDPATGKAAKFKVFAAEENGVKGAKVFRVQ